MNPASVPPDDPGTISVFLDDADRPIAVYRPPAKLTLDTTRLADGEHVMRIEATDALGNVGRRSVPFVVHNGPGITVTGLRAGTRVSGSIEIDINAFSAAEPFDPVRAESQGPVPVWTWVMFVIIAAWAGWYGLEYFKTPAEWAKTPTFASNPARASAFAPAAPGYFGKAPGSSGKSVAGFDYANLGAQVYAANCASCHGEQGTGTPGVFPALAGNPAVNSNDADAHITIVLQGLSGKPVGGETFAAQMPSFERLSNAEIAAVIDHERTSWGNQGPLVTPEQVGRVRSNR